MGSPTNAATVSGPSENDLFEFAGPATVPFGVTGSLHQPGAGHQ
jgi:hypothetical protein